MRVAARRAVGTRLSRAHQVRARDSRCQVRSGGTTPMSSLRPSRVDIRPDIHARFAKIVERVNRREDERQYALEHPTKTLRRGGAKSAASATDRDADDAA